MKKILFVSFICIVSLSTPAKAQTLVSNFGIKVAGSPYHRLATDKKGFTYVFGSFDHFEGKYYGRLLKLDASGKPVTGFPVLYMDKAFYRLVVQPDNKVLISGEFTVMNGSPVKPLIRLNEDGTIDNTFQYSLATAGAFRLQSNGKIIVVSGSQFKRLNTNGSVDNTFIFNSVAGISEFVIGPSDDIYYSFISTLYKASKDGANDNTFHSGSVAIGSTQAIIYSLAVQQDGKVLVGGYFDKYDNATAGSLVRVNPDGTADPNFSIGTGAGGEIHEILIRKNNHIVIGGQFTQFNGLSGSLIELNTDGSMFRNIATVTVNNIESIEETQDSKIIIGGEFQNVNNQRISYIARFDESNTLDPTFRPRVSYINPNGVRVKANDHSLIVSGDPFSTVGIYSDEKYIEGNLSRLNGLGVSTAFLKYSETRSNFLQQDGKLLSVSSFNTLNKKIIRYFPNGEEDTSFNVPDQFMNGANKSTPQYIYEHNDLLFVGGGFQTYGTNASNGLIALNKNGTFNKSFSLPSGSRVSLIAKQNNGKLILVGSFPFPLGTKSIVRLNSDYSIDATFTQSTYSISSVSVDEQDRIYFVGSNLINGIYYTVGRLNADGTFDNTFNASLKIEVNAILYDIEALPGGRVAIGGAFNFYNAQPKSGLVIVNELGNDVAMPFTLGYSSVGASLEYNNGVLFAAGRFVNKDYTDAKSVIKINLENVVLPSAPANLNAAIGQSGNINVTWTDQSTNELVFMLERAMEDNSSSNFVVIDTLDSNTTSFLDKNFENNKKYYYRVRAFNDAGFSPYSNVADFIKVVTGVEHAANELVAVYPVPASDKLYITAGKVFPRSIAVLSTDGRITMKDPIETEGAYVVDVSELPTGVYVMQCIVDGTAVRKRFIKK